jgi:predicted RNA-binding protein with TRAM domain
MDYVSEREPHVPVTVGDTYEVTIEDVGREGDGITRIEGFVVFVPNTKKGDSVKVRITKVSRRVGFGEVVVE